MLSRRNGSYLKTGYCTKLLRSQHLQERGCKDGLRKNLGQSEEEAGYKKGKIKRRWLFLVLGRTDDDYSLKTVNASATCIALQAFALLVVLVDMISVNTGTQGPTSKRSSSKLRSGDA